MNKKIFLLLKSMILITSVLLTACEEEKPELSAKDHHDLAKLYFKQGAFKASIIEGKNALQLKPDDVEILSTMAKILVRLGNTENARELINKALVIDSNNISLKLLLVKSYLAENKLFSAQNALDNIDASNLKNSSEYESLTADLLLANKKPKAAKEKYLSAHKKNQTDVDIIIGIAKSALSLKELSDVDKYTALAIKTAPTSIKALLWQAQVHMLQNKHREAESVLSRAMVELERYDTLTSEKYITIDMLAKTLVAQGKIKESFTYSNYLAQSQPGKVQSSYNEALALISKNVDINEAEKAFQDVLNQAPKHKPSGVILGLINFQKGNYSEADQYLTKFASDENASLRSKKILALTKIKLNKANEAIQLLTETIKTDDSDADLHALLGIAHLKNRDADKSIQYLKKAIKISSVDSSYYMNLSKAYLLKKDTAEAIKSANQALTIKPSSEQARFVLISAYTAANQTNKAKNIANSWLKEKPESITALNIMASLEQEDNRHDKAKIIFQKTLKLDPGNLIANLNMASYDLSENKKTDSLNKITLAINTRPDNLQALSLLLKLSTDKTYTDKSLSTLLSVIAKNPEHVNPRLALSQLYLNINKPKKAISTIEDITKIDNKNFQAYLLKARAYVASSNYSDAKKTYQILNSLDPESVIGYIELAKISIHEKNFNEAIKNANHAISIQPDNNAAYIILATAHLNQNSKDKLFITTNTLKKNIPNSHIPHELEASYYYKNNQYKTAISLLKKAWLKEQNVTLANKIMTAYIKNNQAKEAYKAWDELALKFKDNLKIQVSYSLKLYQGKLYQKSITVLENLLKKHPDNIIVLNNLANVYHDSNNKKALTIAKKAFLISPENPAILDTLGWIYVNQLQDYDKGLPLLKRAYQKNSDPQIKEHLTKALIASGKTNDLKNLQ